MRPQDWATSVDLADAYSHVLVHPRDRKWLRFVWRDRVFQFRALPLGLSLVPWIFTKITWELCCAIRRQGIRLRVHLDVWLILAASQSLCREHVHTLFLTAQSLGFITNPAKLELAPAQSFRFLGKDFDTDRWIVRPSQ